MGRRMNGRGLVKGFEGGRGSWLWVKGYWTMEGSLAVGRRRLLAEGLSEGLGSRKGAVGGEVFDSNG